MSSSRSIAAARNRRVNEPPKPPPALQTQTRPVQSQVQGQSQVPFSRITVSDAIGLITIRLGRVEQLLNKNDFSSKELPPNSQIVDNSVFQTILSRLDVLEKKETSFADLKNEILTEISGLVNDFKSVVDTRFQEIDEAFVELENNMIVEEPSEAIKDDIELIIEE